MERRSIDETLHPVVRVKSAAIRDQFQEMTLEMKGRYAVVFRACDDAMACCWVTDMDILQDGINADCYASDFKQVTTKVH